MSDQYGGWQDPHAGQQPQYPQQYGWGPTPYPAGPSAPQPQPPRRRRVHPAVLIIGGVIVAALVVGGVVALLARHDTVDAPGTDGRRLAIPVGIPGYQALSSVDTGNIKSNFADELAGKGDDRDAIEAHAAVGAFQQEASGARTIFLGFLVQDVGQVRDQLRSDGAEASLKFFMAGVGKSFGAGRASTGFPAGPLKGFLRCSAGTLDGRPATACGWGDESAIGLTVFDEKLALNSAADETRTLRAAIERR